MKKIFLITLLFTSLVCVGCVRIFEPGAKNTPTDNFNTLWDEFNELYALFAIKNVDWDNCYEQYYPMISDKATEKELYSIVTSMLSTLNDGHVFLENNEGQRYYSRDIDVIYPIVFSYQLIKNKYLDANPTILFEETLEYATIDSDIGYVRISSWVAGGGGTAKEKWADYADKLVSALKNTKGIIFDVRDNTGGNYFNAESFASRFTDIKQAYFITRTKNGPGEKDFTSPKTWYISPDGNQQYTNPIIVLINGQCFSANEVFILMMKTLSHVQLVGTITGGGMSSRIKRELPNGWLYSISIQNNTDADSNSYEGIGISPDIIIPLTENDIDNNIDTQIEEAISILK